MAKDIFDQIFEDPFKRIQQHKKEIACYKQMIRINQLCMKYYCSDQWSLSDLEQLRLEGRPAMTFNEIRALINVISGYEQTNATDIKFIGVDKSNYDSWMADMLTRLMKYVANTCNFDSSISQAFKEGLITSSSGFSPMLDFDKDIINGEIKIPITFYDEYYFEPSSREYENTDADWCLELKLLSKYKLMSLFPKHKTLIKELKTSEYCDEIFDSTSNVGYYNSETGLYRYDKTGNRIIEDSDLVFLYADWYYKTKDIAELYDYETDEIKDVGNKKLSGDMLKAINYENENYRRNGKANRYEMNIRTVKVPHVSYMIGDEIVKDVKSPYSPAVDIIPIVPLRCWHTPAARVPHHMYQGMVDSLLCAQDRTNKIYSQIDHIVNMIAKAIRIVDNDAFSTPEEWTDFVNNVNRTGSIFKVKPGARISNLNTYDAGVAQLLGLIDKVGDMKMKISGVNASLLATEDNKQTSGVALDIRRQQGITAIQDPIKNKSRTIKQVARVVAPMILDKFTVEKIVRIIGEEEISESDAAELKEAYNAIRFDVAITEQPISPVLKEIHAERVKNYIKEGLIRFDLIEDLIPDMLDFPEKDVYKQRLLESKQQQKMLGTQIPQEGTVPNQQINAGFPAQQ